MQAMKLIHQGRPVTPGGLVAILGTPRALEALGDLTEALIAQMELLAAACDDAGPSFAMMGHGDLLPPIIAAERRAAA